MRLFGKIESFNSYDDLNGIAIFRCVRNEMLDLNSPADIGGRTSNQSFSGRYVGNAACLFIVF